MRRPKCLVFNWVAAGVMLASCAETQQKLDASGRLPDLPNSPCGFLSAADVATATHLDVVDARRVRPIGEDTGDGSMCSYETQSELGALQIVFPFLGARYECAKRTTDTRALAQSYSGGAVTVCVAPQMAVQVNAQNMVGQLYREVLVSLADAVLSRVQRE